MKRCREAAMRSEVLMVVMVLVVGTNANSTSNSSSSGNSTPAPPTADPTPATSNSDAVTFCPDGGTHVAQVQGLTLATNNSASNRYGGAPMPRVALWLLGSLIGFLFHASWTFVIGAQI